MLPELSHATGRFGSKRILEDISFRVDRGDIVSPIGPSGVGKTILLANGDLTVSRVYRTRGIA